MGRRIDFYDDPSAPQVNSLVPSVNVVVINDAGDVLLIRRTDNGNWAVPSGAIDLGESLIDAAARETREESGIDVEVTEITGIYETSEVRWVPRDDLAGYEMDRSMRLRLAHYLEGRTATSPHLG